ncbi:hypothetical protein [Nocardia sp. NBC_01327]|uniref:hypothetical protein n=1 Tax=Nocardia sp. NBC_01327 TaxID=2903593 RepID=UPI002E100886|nr:hypothetical protein OG326_22455 [Nocardia sp. NBC_01327]
MPTTLTARTPCARCAATLPDDPPGHDRGSLCAACESLPFCDDCGDRVTTVHTTVDDGTLCTDCAARWRECECCELYTSSEDRTVNDGVVCDGCRDYHYWWCSECRLYARSVRLLDNDENVCVDCADQYRECLDCDRLTSSTYCAYCDAHQRDDRIYDYTYKPDPVFHGDGPVYLGLELEVKTPSRALEDCVDIATGHLGRIGYLKEDGSIGYGNGFELVTHPMSYTWAIEEFPWKVLRELRVRGAYIDNEVGIHVHVSRDGFDSPAHVYRWMKFHVAILRGAFGLYRTSPRARELFDHLKRDRDFRRIWNSGLKVAYARQPNELAHLRDPATGEPYSISIDISELADTRDIRVCQAFRQPHTRPIESPRY